MVSDCTLDEWQVLIARLVDLNLLNNEYYLQSSFKNLRKRNGVERVPGPFSARYAFSSIYSERGGIKAFASLMRGARKEVFFKKFLKEPLEDIPLYLSYLETMLPIDCAVLKELIEWRF